MSVAITSTAARTETVEVYRRGSTVVTVLVDVLPRITCCVDCCGVGSKWCPDYSVSDMMRCSYRWLLCRCETCGGRGIFDVPEGGEGK